jgi:hypothetical protein
MLSKARPNQFGFPLQYVQVDRQIYKAGGLSLFGIEQATIHYIGHVYVLDKSFKLPMRVADIDFQHVQCVPQHLGAVALVYDGDMLLYLSVG